MGKRSQRYAIIVQDGKVKELLVEPGPGGQRVERGVGAGEAVAADPRSESQAPVMSRRIFTPGYVLYLLAVTVLIVAAARYSRRRRRCPTRWHIQTIRTPRTASCGRSRVVACCTTSDPMSRPLRDPEPMHPPEPELGPCGAVAEVDAHAE
jgi:hypothetical protein